jgi:hypothetical protein
MMRHGWRHAVGAVTRRDPLEQPDLLGPEELLPVTAGHSGFPEATDGLAYEPIQRLLAVRSRHRCHSVFGWQALSLACRCLDLPPGN